MQRYILKRTLTSLLLIFGITFLSFLIIHIAPGDPTTLFALNPSISQADLQHLRQAYGLNKPIYIQYWLWLKKILQGDLGTSIIYRENVAKIIAERLPATLLLMGSSLIIALLLSIYLGLVSAFHKNRFLDKLCSYFAYFSISTPSFWLAIMAVYIFYYKLNWIHDIGSAQGITISKMILPFAVLVIGDMGFLLRYIRNRALEVLNAPFVLEARARGIPEQTIMWRYVFRNAALPLITILGMSLPALFSGAAIIERIFSWPGMGWLTFEAVFKFDYPLIMGILFISSVLVIVGNFLADVIYVFVDPRIHYEKKNE